jgi:hypothetical protein
MSNQDYQKMIIRISWIIILGYIVYMGINGTK